MVVASVTVAYFLARPARAALPQELTPATIQAWVATLGWQGPVLYVAILTFRRLLLIPAGVLLVAGGLCFGITAATLLGGLGIVLSAAIRFGVARGVWRPWLARRWGGSGLGARVNALGPFTVSVTTAHPIGPMAWIHFLAGLSPLSFATFAVAVAVGAPARAFVYALLGSTLLDVGSPRFVAAVVALLAVALLPLLHPRTRQRIFMRPSPAATAPRAAVP